MIYFIFDSNARFFEVTTDKNFALRLAKKLKGYILKTSTEKRKGEVVGVAKGPRRLDYLFDWLRRVGLPLSRWHIGTNFCPKCHMHFSEWFWWPEIGDYCLPCFQDYEELYARHVSEETTQ